MDLQFKPVWCTQDSHENYSGNREGNLDSDKAVFKAIFLIPDRNSCLFIFQSFSELFVSFLESESEAMLPVGQGSRLSNINNPLLSGLAPQQSAATHRGLPSGPTGQPIATSTPVGTPARSNMPSLPPSSISRPLSGSTLSATDGSTRYV